MKHQKTKETVWSLTYKLLGDYPEKFKNKSDIAKDIGIGYTYFYAFFRGSRILEAKYLKIIAKYFNLSEKEVTEEHYKNVEKLKDGM